MPIRKRGEFTLANIAKTDLESLQTLVAGSSNVTSEQIKQSQSILYTLLVALFGPTAISTILGKVN